MFAQQFHEITVVHVTSPVHGQHVADVLCVHISAVGNEHPPHGEVSLLCGMVQGSLSFGSSGVHVCVMCQEQFDHLRLPLGSSKVQGGERHVVSSVHVRASAKEQFGS